MTKLDFSFSQHLYQSVLDGQTSMISFINEVLNALDDKGKPNLNTLVFYLRFNHADEGGSPEIAGLVITDTNYDAKKQKGQIRIKYNIERHYTCSDVKSRQKDTEALPFKLNLTEGVLELTIPEEEDRDTAGEF